MKLMPRFRWLPMPQHSLLLWLVWMFLNSFSPGHLVLGGILALIIPLLAAPLTSPQPEVQRPSLVPIYMLRLILDIVVSNVEVAIRVLGPMNKLQPAFIALPLDLTGNLPLTILASTISLTPGTVSVEFSSDRHWLYIHALHVDDESAMIARIKQRYEQPLKEMFQC